jgi:hypothetical protein
VAIATLERLQRDAGLTRGNAVDLDDAGFQQFTVFDIWVSFTVRRLAARQRVNYLE